MMGRSEAGEPESKGLVDPYPTAATIWLEACEHLTLPPIQSAPTLQPIRFRANADEQQKARFREFFVMTKKTPLIT